MRRRHCQLFFVLGPSLLVCDGQGQESAAPHLSFDALSAQVECARQLRTVEPTDEQLARLRKIAEQVAASQREFRLFRESDRSRAAARKARDAAARGATDEAVWAAFEPIHEETNRLQTAAQEAAEKGARAAAALFTPDQLARLILLQIASPSDLMGQATEQRAKEPAAWREWREHVCGQLATQATGKEEGPAHQEFRKVLESFFDRIRNMPTDEFYEKRDGLTRELRATLRESIVQHLDEERRNVARNTLQTWLTSDGFVETLQRYQELGR